MLGIPNLKQAQPLSAGLVQIRKAQSLLSEHRALLDGIRSTIGIPDDHWRLLYLPLFARFAEFVQSLPASEAHHHCEEGGLLRHGLEVVDVALRLRRAHVLPPGKEPEEVADEQDVWTYATATAAILHDIGKPLVDQVVTLYGRDGLPTSVWSPWVGSMADSAGKHYKLEFRRDREYRLHEAITPLLATDLIPTDGMRWLGQHHDALAAWVTALGGNAVGSTIIAEIVSEADGLSVGKDLSGARQQVGTARAKPLAERLLVELRELLSNGELPMNRKGAAVYIDGNTAWLVSKRCLDALRESMKARGQGGVPTRNDRLMDELQQRGIAIATDDERAVWTCEVRVGEADDVWEQKLTMLKVPIEQIWTDPEARPTLPSVIVTVVEGGETEPVAKRIEPTLGGAEVKETAASKEADDDAEDIVTLDDIEFDEEESLGDTEQATAEAESRDLGEEFVVWLVDGLRTGALAVNTAKARVHVVEEGLLLVSPAVFRTFAGERWTNAQKRFLKRKMTAKTPNGENIFHYVVSGERGKKTIKGILIRNAEEKLAVSLPAPNSMLSLKAEG